MDNQKWDEESRARFLNDAYSKMNERYYEKRRQREIEDMMIALTCLGISLVFFVATVAPRVTNWFDSSFGKQHDKKEDVNPPQQVEPTWPFRETSKLD